MTDRLIYTLRQALKLKTGSWFTPAQVEDLLAYLRKEGVDVREVVE
jgi:hypothetical protein